MTTVTTEDGAEIYYKDWGTGQPIVLSHGWPLSSEGWAGQMLFLAQHGYRVIADDRRGYRRSSQPSSGNNIDTYADSLASVIDHLDLKNVRGEDDQIVPVMVSSKKSEKLIRDAKEIYYSGGAHGITATQPGRVDADLLEFLKESRKSSKAA